MGAIRCGSLISWMNSSLRISMKRLKLLIRQSRRWEAGWISKPENIQYSVIMWQLWTPSRVVSRPMGLGSSAHEFDGYLKNADRNMIKWDVNNIRNLVKRITSTSMAGGFGLMLNGAKRVWLLSHSWNSATDAQCVGRVCRLAQYRYRHYVHRLLDAGLSKLFLIIYRSMFPHADAHFENWAASLSCIAACYVKQHPANALSYYVFSMTSYDCDW